MTDEPDELPPEVAAALQQLDHLMQMFTQHPDEDVQDAVIALLRAVDVLHRGGLHRLGELLHARSVIDEALADPHIALLFALYQPEEDGDQRARAENALASIRAEVEARGGLVEVVTAEGGVINVRLLAAADAAPAAAEPLRRLVEEALHTELPDLVRVDISSRSPLSREPAAAGPVLIPLSSIKRRPRASSRGEDAPAGRDLDGAGG